MAKKFQRTIEDFVCENCGKKINGNGYTNHCPFCLFSKHVDVHPGDRAARCGGLMNPKSVVRKGDEFIITHECMICHYQKKNKATKNDNFEELIKVAMLGH